MITAAISANATCKFCKSRTLYAKPSSPKPLQIITMERGMLLSTASEDIYTVMVAMLSAGRPCSMSQDSTGRRRGHQWSRRCFRRGIPGCRFEDQQGGPWSASLAETISHCCWLPTRAAPAGTCKIVMVHLGGQWWRGCTFYNPQENLSVTARFLSP